VEGFAFALRLFTKMCKLSTFYWPRTHHRAPMGMKFQSAKRFDVLVARVNVHMNHANE